MSVTVRQLADWVRGEVDGDGSVPIHAARPLGEAGPGDVTLVENERNSSAWHDSPASAALVSDRTAANGRPVIRVADPLLAFAEVVVRLRGRHPSPPSRRIDPAASVHPTAVVGENVTVAPFAVVGEGAVLGDGCHLHAGVVVGAHCRLGANVTLHPHVVVYAGCTLGDRVTVHANSVIGADGFGYRHQAGRHVKVPQVGGVEVGDDVEIGACSTIDAGTFSPSQIGAGTKIDNLVQVAHNCRIGRHNVLVAQVGIAGSCTTGDYVVMAGQVGIGDHLTIGDRAVIGAKAGVMQNVPADATMLGSPATPKRDQMRLFAIFAKLPEMRRELRKVQRHLGLTTTAEEA